MNEIAQVNSPKSSRRQMISVIFAILSFAFLAYAIYIFFFSYSAEEDYARKPWISFGKSCGGLFAAPNECPAGYECKYNGPFMDSGGICSKKSPEVKKDNISPNIIFNEQFCGGFAGIACSEGYHCQLEGKNPDASGKCVEVK